MPTTDPAHLERVRATLHLLVTCGPAVDTAGLTDADAERVAEALADAGVPAAQVLDRELYAQALLQGVAIALLPEKPASIWVQLFAGRALDWIETAAAEPLLDDDTTTAVAA